MNASNLVDHFVSNDIASDAAMHEMAQLLRDVSNPSCEDVVLSIFQIVREAYQDIAMIANLNRTTSNKYSCEYHTFQSALSDLERKYTR